MALLDSVGDFFNSPAGQQVIKSGGDLAVRALTSGKQNLSGTGTVQTPAGTISVNSGTNQNQIVTYIAIGVGALLSMFFLFSMIAKPKK